MTEGDYSGDWVVVGFTFTVEDRDGKEKVLGKIGGYKMMSAEDPRLGWKQQQWLDNPQAFDWSTPILQMAGCIFVQHALAQVMLNLLQAQMGKEVTKREVEQMWQSGLEGVNLDPEERTWEETHDQS